MIDILKVMLVTALALWLGLGFGFWLSKVAF